MSVLTALQKKLLFEREYWGTQAAGILPFCPKTQRFLLSFRSEYVMQPNTWGVWGGKLDEGETNVKAAALREFKEETDYDGPMKLVSSYVFKDENFEYHNFIGVVPEEFDPYLDWETEDFEWITFDQLIRLSPKHFGLEELLKHNKAQIRGMTDVSAQ